MRVNDRGPFHGDRIIDLSYAAALKLGYADRGTARVQLDAIVVNKEGRAVTYSNSQPASPGRLPENRWAVEGIFRSARSQRCIPRNGFPISCASSPVIRCSFGPSTVVRVTYCIA